MITLCTLTKLSRALDTTPCRLRRKVSAGILTPAALNPNGVPLFDISKVEEYRAALLEPR